MKATFGSIEVEGTPEEIGALIRSLSPELLEARDEKKPAIASRQYVSEKVAFRALKRRPLSREQSNMLALLRDNHPAWTSANDIRKATNYSPTQMAGMFGAFGKRVGATDGYIPGTWFFEQEWDYEQDCYQYRLSAEALSAVRRVKL